MSSTGCRSRAGERNVTPPLFIAPTKRSSKLAGSERRKAMSPPPDPLDLNTPAGSGPSDTQYLGAIKQQSGNHRTSASRLRGRDARRCDGTSGGRRLTTERDDEMPVGR